MTDGRTAEERANKRTEDYLGFMWHLATYVIVNLFMWGIDLVTGQGINFAYWVTIPWGVGLLFHGAAYFLDTSGVRERTYQRFLEEEQQKDAPT